MSLSDQVVAHLRAVDWPDYIVDKAIRRQGSVEEMIALIGRSMVPCVGGELQVDAGVEAGASKVGGLPDVPAGFAWPEDDQGEPMALVCQISLAQVAPHADTPLPPSGMLYLFSIYDADRAYSGEIEDWDTARFVWVPEPDVLTPAVAPEGLDPEEGIFAERAIAWGPSGVLEEVEDGNPRSLRFDNSVEVEIREGFRAAGGRALEVQMLGHPHFFDEILIEDYDMASEVLLLEVSGYTVADHAFGEGDFFVVISRSKLAAGDLGSARVVFEGGS